MAVRNTDAAAVARLDHLSGLHHDDLTAPMERNP
jgi:hypothetical protein